MRYWKPRTIADNPKVGIAVAAYLSATVRDGPALECLCSALQAQTYHNWYALVVHDGPTAMSDERVLKGIRDREDERFETWVTAERKQQFGHPWRQPAVERLLQVGCEWVGLTNQDNYYCPVYLEWMLSEAQRHKAPFVYCDFVRSHKQWAVHNSRPKKGQLDLGAFLAHKSIVSKIKFDKLTFDGDGDYINRLVQAAKHRVAKVSAPLMVHN